MLKEPEQCLQRSANWGLKRAGLPGVTLESDVDSASIIRVFTQKPTPQTRDTITASSQESVLSHVQAIEKNDRLISDQEEEVMDEDDDEEIALQIDGTGQGSFLPPVQPTYLATKLSLLKEKRNEEANLRH